MTSKFKKLNDPDVGEINFKFSPWQKHGTFRVYISFERTAGLARPRFEKTGYLNTVTGEFVREGSYGSWQEAVEALGAEAVKALFEKAPAHTKASDEALVVEIFKLDEALAKATPEQRKAAPGRILYEIGPSHGERERRDARERLELIAPPGSLEEEVVQWLLDAAGRHAMNYR